MVVRHLQSKETAAFNADAVFRAASLIKVPILVDLLWQIKENRLSLEETVVLNASDLVGGSGVLKELHSGIELTLRDLARLMIVTSDNVASNLLLERLTMDRVNERLRSLGFDRTRIRRKFMDFKAVAAGLENTTTPAEMARLFEMLYRKENIPPPVCEEAIAILSRQQDREKIPRYLPEEMVVAHKTGELPGAVHDAGIIYAPDGPYVLAVLCEGQPDRATGEETIGRIALALYRFYTRQED